jgi:predicted transglutaminase-like protease
MQPYDRSTCDAEEKYWGMAAAVYGFVVFLIVMSSLCAAAGIAFLVYLYLQQQQKTAMAQSEMTTPSPMQNGN